MLMIKMQKCVLCFLTIIAIFPAIQVLIGIQIIINWPISKSPTSGLIPVRKHIYPLVPFIDPGRFILISPIL